MINGFEKVSFEQFYNDCMNHSDKFKMDKIEIEDIYNNIKLPARATQYSAGYDFFSPFDITLKSGESIKIPTGIRVKIAETSFLLCVPRSGLGFKYRLQLDNTCGIIDSDYYYSDNEGHIFAKFTNDSKIENELKINAGTAFMQGIFLFYSLTDDDNASAKRNGGFNSTSGVSLL